MVKTLLSHVGGTDLIPSWRVKGRPCGSECIELACITGDPGSIPWVGKIPWKRKWQPTPVFLPGESPWTEEPGGLQFMGLQRVRHNWATWLFFTFWRIKIPHALGPKNQNVKQKQCYKKNSINPYKKNKNKAKLKTKYSFWAQTLGHLPLVIENSKWHPL